MRGLRVGAHAARSAGGDSLQEDTDDVVNKEDLAEEESFAANPRYVRPVLLKIAQTCTTGASEDSADV